MFLILWLFSCIGYSMAEWFLYMSFWCSMVHVCLGDLGEEVGDVYGAHEDRILGVMLRTVSLSFYSQRCTEVQHTHEDYYLPSSDPPTHPPVEVGMRVLLHQLHTIQNKIWTTSRSRRFPLYQHYGAALLIYRG